MIYQIFKIFNTVLSLFGYALIGIGCAKYSQKADGTNSYVTLFILFMAMYVCILLHVIIHEFGHLIAGLLTGYSFVSFRIGSYIWIKGADEKLHLKKMKLQGTGGQCLLAPPNVPAKQCPYKWYHLSGGLINIVTGTFTLLLFLFAFPQNALTFVLCCEFGIIGITTGLTNLIPCKMGGIQNDGYNLIDISKNIQAKTCINLVLEMNARLTVAQTVSDVPKELIDRLMSIDFTKMDLTNVAVANAFNYQIFYYFVNEDYEKVHELSKFLVETPGVLELFKNEAKCECLYYEIMHEQNSERINDLYDKKLKKYVKATSIYPSRQRLLYAYYHFYEKNEELAEKAYNNLVKSVDTHSIKVEALSELALVEKLRNNRESKTI